MQDAVLPGRRCALLLGDVDGFRYDASIVGMYALKEALQGSVELLEGESMDSLELLRPRDSVGLDVPLPASDMGDLLGLRELGFLLAQLLGALQHCELQIIAGLSQQRLGAL